MTVSAILPKQNNQVKKKDNSNENINCSTALKKGLKWVNMGEKSFYLFKKNSFIYLWNLYCSIS